MKLLNTTIFAFVIMAAPTMSCMQRTLAFLEITRTLDLKRTYTDFPEPDYPEPNDDNVKQMALFSCPKQLPYTCVAEKLCRPLEIGQELFIP